MSVERLVVVDVGLDLLGEPGDADLLRVLAQETGTLHQVLCHVHVARRARQEVTIVGVGDVLAAAESHVVDDLSADLLASDVDVVHTLGNQVRGRAVNQYIRQGWTQQKKKKKR